MRYLVGRSMIFLMLVVTGSWSVAGDSEEAFWRAAKTGDVAVVQQQLNEGIDVNSKTKYGAGALAYACDRGHTDVVRILLKSGADVNATDTFYGFSAMDWAYSGGHHEIVRLLLAAGAGGAEKTLRNAVTSGQQAMVTAVLGAVEIQPGFLFSCRDLALERGHKEVAQSIDEILADLEIETVDVSQEELESYAGMYANENGQKYKVEIRDGHLWVGLAFQAVMRLRATKVQEFQSFNNKYVFQVQDGSVVGLTREGVVFKKLSAEEARPQEPAVTSPETVDEADFDDVDLQLHRPQDLAVSSPNWPQFRGTGARGIGDEQNAPTQWNVPEQQGLRWKTPIAGLGNSCPIVWGNRVFLTTAISESGDTSLRTGLYGDVAGVDDNVNHTWQVVCIDLASGEKIWEKTSSESVPRYKRHLKSTHANPTPVTDGRHVVALFGPQGLFCYDVNGNLLWSKDLGDLSSGWFYDEDYQWGFGSSPVLFENTVIVQCDVQKGSFIAAYDLKSGDEVWKVQRDEIPTWATPTVYDGPGGPLLITNGTHFARGYDPRTGDERWRLSGHSEIAVPTPYVVGDRVLVTSGYRPIKPIYAIRLTARGDISLVDGQSSNEHIVWSHQQGGPYLVTPISYRGCFYTCTNNGILSCYDAKSGQRVYRKRISGGGAESFTASPVAADEKVFFTSEQGVVVVVSAGPKFELLGTNNLGATCLATPAISRGQMLFRTQHHLIAVGQPLPRPIGGQGE